MAQHLVSPTTRCLLSGTTSSSVSLWFLQSALTQPANLELQAVIVLVTEKIHSLMGSQVLHPVNPDGKKTTLHPNAQFINVA